MLLMFFIFMVIVIGFSLYFICQILKWILKKTTRLKAALIILGTLFFSYSIHHFFLKKMTVINSKVYPNLYLVQYPVEDIDTLHHFVKKKILKKLKNRKQHSPINFYQYFTGNPFIPFGPAGTSHFIENKEDPGGFSSEELFHYYNYHIAEYKREYCNTDSLNYVETINYYQNGEIIKTDTLISFCKKIKYEEGPFETIHE